LNKVTAWIAFEEKLSECYDDPATKKEVMADAHSILINAVAERLASNNADGIMKCIEQDDFECLSIYTKFFAEAGIQCEKILAKYIHEHTETAISKILSTARPRIVKKDKLKSDGGLDFADTALVKDLLEGKEKLDILVAEGFNNRMEVQKARD